MSRDITGDHAPFLFTLFVEAIKHARGNIISGVSNEDILCLGMHHDAVGLFDLFVGAVGNDFPIDDLSRAGVHDRVGDIPAVGDVTEFGAVDVQQVVVDPVVGGGDGDGVGHGPLFPVNEKEASG